MPQVLAVLDTLTEKIPDLFDKAALAARDMERTPYVSVALQECAAMNRLVTAISRDLAELRLGLKGDLTMSSAMDALARDLYLNVVPSKWLHLSGPSLKRLGEWFDELYARSRELDAWVANSFEPPASAWISALFNPQSFLTAVLQTAARKNGWPLDRMAMDCEVTRKTAAEITSAPREGAYVHGFFLEGARWDPISLSIQPSNFKELHCAMPVVLLKPVTNDKLETLDKYECPVYGTRARSRTYVCTLHLRTERPPQHWILAAVAMLLSSA